MHQNIFQLFGMLASLSLPGQDRVFFEAFDSGQAADPTAFCQQSQGFQNLVFRRPLAVEDRAYGLRERSFAGLALIALDSAFRLA